MSELKEKYYERLSDVNSLIDSYISELMLIESDTCKGRASDKLICLSNLERLNTEKEILNSLINNA